LTVSTAKGNAEAYSFADSTEAPKTLADTL